jgi:hypothetical protein
MLVERLHLGYLAVVLTLAAAVVDLVTFAEFRHRSPFRECGPIMSSFDTRQ